LDFKKQLIGDSEKLTEELIHTKEDNSKMKLEIDKYLQTIQELSNITKAKNKDINDNDVKKRNKKVSDLA
jgi:hypothetical protein